MADCLRHARRNGGHCHDRNAKLVHGGTGEKYILDPEWKGQAKTDITFGQYYVGGLFVRMPWHVGDRAEAVNSNGRRDKDAEAERAKWVDLGIQVEGRNDLAHIVIFDSPDNKGFPIAWRVDNQFGFGPDRSWREWKMKSGQTELLHYRLIACTGKFNPVAIAEAYKAYDWEISE